MREPPASRGSNVDHETLGRASKARLEELLAFAQIYRGWTAKDLAAFIGRDVHNVVPPSGVPKADLVLQVAKALDWAPGAVFEYICGISATAPPTGTSAHAMADSGSADDYRELNRAAYRAFGEGLFENMIALGLRMEHVASSPEDRAEACLRQYGGWEGLGRYEQAVEVLHRGLRERDLSINLRLRLRGNLAMAYFSLGRWMEAQGVASAVLERLARPEGLDPSISGSRAAALYAMGMAKRSRALHEFDERRTLAASALRDLYEASVACQRHSDQSDGCPSYSAAAHTCLGAIVTTQALAEEVAPEAAIDRVMEEIERVPSAPSHAPRAMVESFGWWCVFGSELALEVDPSNPSRDHLLARLTLQGLELAESANNWALRERLLTIDYLRWSSQEGEHADQAAAILDREDVRMIAGAMARFPGFRPFGRELVRRATRID